MKFQNQFSVTRINLDTFDYPKVKVSVWSRVFEPGGSVNIGAKTPEGMALTLYSEDIDEDREVSDERDQLQEMADEWNENCRENWRSEILRCLRYVADYERREIESIQDRKNKLSKYEADIAKLESEEERG